jgi:hypothetical protein
MQISFPFLYLSKSLQQIKFGQFSNFSLNIDDIFDGLGEEKVILISSLFLEKEKAVFFHLTIIIPFDWISDMAIILLKIYIRFMIFPAGINRGYVQLGVPYFVEVHGKMPALQYLNYEISTKMKCRNFLIKETY